MAAGENKTMHLKTQLNELVKQYIAYDASLRTEYVYTAPTDAADGTPCTRVQYVYSGATTRIVKMKETVDTWVSATYDI